MAAVRRAVLDIGSNAVKLTLCSVHPSKGLTTLLDSERVSRLGQLQSEGSGSGAADFEPTLAAIGELLEQASQHKPKSVDAVATWALRQRGLAEPFAAQLAERFGLRLRLLCGHEEAVAGYIAARREGHAKPDELLASFDLGGGSGELTLGSGELPYRNDSFDLGARLLLEECPANDVLSGEQLQTLHEAARRRTAALPRLAPGTKLVLLGGAATTLAAYRRFFKHGNSEGPLPRRLSRRRLDKLIERLAAMSLRQRAELPGVNGDRADVIVHGAVLLRQALEQLGVEQGLVSLAGLGHGLLEAERLGLPLAGKAQAIVLPRLDFYPLTRTDRSGEVLFALRRSDGKVYLQTKRNYPEGIWRIPGGGVNLGEDPREAVHREIAEESGARKLRTQLLTRLHYVGPDGSVLDWFTDLYLADIGDHQPQAEDKSEGISGWLPVDPRSELTPHIEGLENMAGESHAWGVFRAAAMRQLRQRAHQHGLP